MITAALVTALESWDVLARMGQFEHQARMKDVVAAGPSLTPVDRDDLGTRIITAEGAKEFARSVAEVDHSLRLEWSPWAETLPQFRSLFAGTADLDEATLVLGDWFVETSWRSRTDRCSATNGATAWTTVQPAPVRDGQVVPGRARTG